MSARGRTAMRRAGIPLAIRAARVFETANPGTLP